MAESISKIEPAPIAKRLFAAIMDALVFIFLFFGLAAFPVTPIAEAGLGYKEITFMLRIFMSLKRLMIMVIFKLLKLKTLGLISQNIHL